MKFAKHAQRFVLLENSGGSVFSSARPSELKSALSGSDSGTATSIVEIDGPIVEGHRQKADALDSQITLHDGRGQLQVLPRARRF